MKGRVGLGETLFFCEETSIRNNTGTMLYASHVYIGSPNGSLKIPALNLNKSAKPWPRPEIPAGLRRQEVLIIKIPRARLIQNRSQPSFPHSK